jgi:DNA polymerase III alpha subunit (gram-positive type)
MDKVHICLDLETTGLSPQSEIIQIGAVHENGETFERVLLPHGDIERDASNVNGFTKRHGRLYKNGQEVRNATSPRSGLIELLNWIKYNPSNVNKDVVLVSHNAHRFDAPILINNILNNNAERWSDLCQIITGFGDTLKSFRRHYEGPYGLNDLMRSFGLQRRQTHDALQDALDLKEVVRRASNHCQLHPSDFVSEFQSTRDINLGR